MKSRFAKFLAMMLVVTLVFGQGMPVMAMSAMSADQMPAQMSMNMTDMDMSASDKADCCGPSATDKAMKGAACDACCASMAQTAMLPTQFPVHMQYAVAYSYDLTNITAASKALPPESPPPKA
ncbi:MAG: hypothetical protein WAO98_08070 [Alphaproteobacteria bacterium]